MVELFKYTTQIEEKLLKNDQRNDVQNPQIKNILVDSFILGYISGSKRDSKVKYQEFKKSLKIVQQLRALKEINVFKNEQLIALYNNIFVNFYDIQDVYNVIEFQLQQPIEQQNFNNVKKSQNQINQVQQQQTQTSSKQSQFQTSNQQKKQNNQNFNNFNNNQFQNFNQNQQQVTNQTNNFIFQNQFPNLFVPPQTLYKQNQQTQNSQNFNQFNLPINNQFPEKKQNGQINSQQQLYQSTVFQSIKDVRFAPTNPFRQTISGQFQQNPLISQQSQKTFQQQPIKQQESQNKNPFQQYFQEQQQNENQFPNSDTFIINEMKQIRESVTTSNNKNQQYELRKSQNIARIQQQIPSAHIFEKKIEQNSEVKMKQEQDENKELQSEFDQEDLDNIKLDFKRDCDICFAQLDLEDMMVLDCGHIFHLNCLNQTCLTQMQSRQFPIYCPNQNCKTPIIYNDLAKILERVNLELYEQLTFQQYIESHGDEYSWCPTPDCKFVFISEGENHFQCPVCTIEYCLNCKVEFHNDLSCEQYMSFKDVNKEDQSFYQFVLGAKCKQCPKCKFWVEKNKGCNHMTCRCKFEFCYSCGQDYRVQCKCRII